MKIAPFVSILLILIASCNNDNTEIECIEGPIKIEHFDCGIYPNFYLPTFPINEYRLIRSKIEYDSLVDGRCHPGIDFSKYDLIVGAQALTTGLDTVIYESNRICPENQLFITITIKRTYTSVGTGGVGYNAIIPKLENENDLFVEVNVSPEL